MPPRPRLLRDSWGADRFIVADTSFGKIRGVEANGICTFKGIPYGASTVGKNRFGPWWIADLLECVRV